MEQLEYRWVPARVDFVGLGDGFSWEDPANWSTGVLPGPEDDVVSNTHSIVHLSGRAESVRSFGGTLETFFGSLTLAAPSEFNDRVLNEEFTFNGTLHLLSGARLEMNRLPLATIEGDILIEDGAEINFFGGDFYLDASIRGSGVAINHASSLTWTGSGPYAVETTFNNYFGGTVTVQAGTLDFQGGGTLAGGTFWTGSPGAVLLLTDGTYEVTQDFTSGGAGLIVFGTAEDLGDSGKGGAGKRLDIRLTPSGDGLIYNQRGDLAFEGGRIVGQGMFIQRTGTLTWKQGIMARAGTPIPGGASTVIENGASMQVEGAGPKQLTEWTIENKAGGSVKLENTTVTYLRGAFISNQGRFTLTGASRILPDTSQPVTFESFVNSGDFFKDGAGAAEIRTPFTNLAHFHLQTGTLNLSGGLTQSASTARIFLDGNTLSAAGTLRILGGKLIGPGTLNANLALEGGEIEFVDRRGTLNINGNYTQHAGARLLLRFEGAQFDRVQITGTATLAGTLRVQGGDTAPAGIHTVMEFNGGSQGSFDLFDAPGFTSVILDPFAIRLRKD